MASTTTSRLGRAPGSGAKEPCDAVSQGSPITRSGLYTLGGVALLSGMRVFDKDAADPTTIGIYIANAGPWSRAPDWNKDDDIRSGVIVAARSANGVTETYQITFIGDHRIGTTEYVVTRFDVNAGTLVLEYGRIFADTYLAAVTIAALPGILDGTVFEIAADETAPPPYTNKPYLYTKTGGVLVPTGPALAPGAIGFARSTTPEAALPATVSDMNAAMQYLEGYIRANAYNALDPKWGIVQKLTSATPLQTVRAEVQALLDYAETRRNVTPDNIYKNWVYFPGARYAFDGTVYVSGFGCIFGDLPQYGSFGTVFQGLSGFNSGAGGDIVRCKATVDPTSGAGFWGGMVQGISFLGAADGSVGYGFASKTSDGSNIEVQDTAVLDFLGGQYLASGGMYCYGGVPLYIRRPRFYDCNGPAIDLIGNVGKHNITHVLEPSCDQCHNGMVRLTNWSDGDVCVITAAKSERSDSIHNQNYATSDSFYSLLAGWKDAGHDGQKNLVYLKTPNGGQLDIRGAHHISAWNAKQLFTYSGDTFTVPTKSELTEGMPIRFSANTSGNVFSNAGATLPTGLVANTDYYVHVLTNKTFKVATSPANLAAGIYVTPTGGAFTWFADPGYLTAGDLIGWDGTGQLPDTNWSGAYIRYRPFATGGVERIGTKPNIISAVPASDPTGSSPRTVDFPLEASSGRLLRANVGIAEVASSQIGDGTPTRRSVRMLGVTNYPATGSLLGEDSVFVAGGKIPAFMLYDVDAAANQKIVIMRLNGGTWHLTKINDDGTFSSLLSIDGNGNITPTTGALWNNDFLLPNGRKIGLGSVGLLPIVGSGSVHRVVLGDTVYRVNNLNPDAEFQAVGTLPAFSLYDTDAPANQRHWLIRSNGGLLHVTAVKDDGSTASLMQWITDSSGNPQYSKFLTNVLMDEGKNIEVGTTTGSSLAASVSQKTGMHGARVVQRAGAAQTAVATTASTTTTPFGYTTQAQADGIVTLLNEIRAALVEKGIIKGSA